MHLIRRIIAVALLSVLAGLLAGCSSVNIPSWDPSDLLDFLDTKRRAPGERRPVFPEGVPGMTQGVPAEYRKGTPEHQAAMATADPTLSPPPVEQPVAEAPEAGSKGKKRAAKPASATARQPAAAPPQDGSNADEGSPDTEMPPAAPPPRKRAAKKPAASQAAAPDQPQPPSAPPSQQSQSAFPAPLPSGSFQR